MKAKWILMFLVLFGLVASLAATQNVMAAERTVVLKTPGCV